MWRIVLLVALAAGWLAATPGSPAQAGGPVVLSIESTSGVVGQPVQVNITVAGMPEPGLGAWTVDPTWDPTKVQAERCSPFYGAVCSLNFAANQGRLTGANKSGLVGSFLLGAITFRCLVPGTSPLSITTNVFADATFGNPQPITLEVQGGTITCVDGPPTATPAPVLPSAGTADDTGRGAPTWSAALLSAGAIAFAAGAFALRRRA